MADAPPSDPFVSWYLWTFGRSPPSIRVLYRAKRLVKFKSQGQTWANADLPPVENAANSQPFGALVLAGSYMYRRWDAERRQNGRVT
jgi:hypothetical protein